MNEYLNTLYITQERAYLHLDHDTIRMEIGSETKFRMPLLHLSSIVCFGNILVSPALLHKCASDGRALVFLDEHGHFKARIEGPTHGNILLRHTQHLTVVNPLQSLNIARNIVAGKIQNSRQILLRAYRESNRVDDKARLSIAFTNQEQVLSQLQRCATIDQIRGNEGEAARSYFCALDAMILKYRDAFAFKGRTRRPPLDRINALLSFLYTLLRSDCVSAIEGTGLDPQAGFLHVLRPGRPALALDLMEELRPILADRLAFSLINREQIRQSDFVEQANGAVYLTTEARKKILFAYQKRKQDEVFHRVLDKKIMFGLLPHIQARLLARHIRGDVPDYLPFLYR